MKERMINNNRVTISGEIVSDFTYSHEVYGEKFYTFKLSSKRLSDKGDIIPIMASDRLFDLSPDCKNQYVKINGQFRSYNKHDGEENHLVLSVFAREVFSWEDEGEPIPNDENSIYIEGFICKEPKYRKTPLGREIADVLLAVNRPYRKSDYIPCIAWGRNARYAGNFEVGTRISIEGRIQSRDYQKRVGGDEYETRTAYEVSVSRINVIEETEDE